MKVLQRLLSLVAMLFGVATVVAGSRVLLGATPGYAVYLPLLVFNTAMGVAYVAAGAAGWSSARRGRQAAAAISALNLLALAGAGSLYLNDGGVAIESVRAMALRTGVWLLLLVGFFGLARRVSREPAGNPGAPVRDR